MDPNNVVVVTYEITQVESDLALAFSICCNPDSAFLFAFSM